MLGRAVIIASRIIALAARGDRCTAELKATPAPPPLCPAMPRDRA